MRERGFHLIKLLRAPSSALFVTALVVAHFGLLHGCGASSPAVDIQRRLDGQLVLGPAIPPEAYAHFIRAEYAVENERFQEADAAYRRAQELSPLDPYLMSRWADALDCGGQGERASALLDRADAHFAHSAWLRLARARIAVRRGDRAQARRWIEGAIQISPSAEQGPLLLAQLAENSRDRSHAITALEAVISARGSGSLAVFRALFSLAVAARDMERARHILEVLGSQFQGVFAAQSGGWAELIDPEDRPYVCSLMAEPPPTLIEQIDCP